MIIDGENLIVGRLASVVAKKALNGENIEIVNCEKAIMTGSKKNLENRFKSKLERGDPYHGPFVERRADRFVKRLIRGMLPYKQYRGKEAFKRIKCYNNVPEKLKNEKFTSLKNVHVSKVKSLKFMTIKNVTRIMGGR